MKVYVLIIESCYDYEQTRNTFVYSNLRHAKRDMERGIETWLHEKEEDWEEQYHDDHSCMYQEPGDYSRNHIEWSIEEKSIIDQDEFPVITLMREDLEQKGFDTSNLGDEWMEKIASKVGDILLDSDYWDHLAWAAEYYKVPRKEEDEP